MISIAIVIALVAILVSIAGIAIVSIPSSPIALVTIKGRSAEAPNVRMRIWTSDLDLAISIALRSKRRVLSASLVEAPLTMPVYQTSIWDTFNESIQMNRAPLAPSIN